MNKHLLRFTVTTMLVVASFTGDATAQVNLTLTPTVFGLDELEIGSPVTFLIELTNLPAGGGLDSLFATVEFEGGLLGTPTLSTGGVLPDPLNEPFDFVSVEAAGLADGAFATLGIQPAAHISSAGVFYSFQVTPQAAGSGTVAFQFVDATQFNSADPDNPNLIGAVAGPPINFTVIGDLPGDYNGNEVVDAADYTVWRDNLGRTGSPGIDGDGSGPTAGTPDGVVNQFDYDFWSSQFGATSGSATAVLQLHSRTVPEPTLPALLLPMFMSPLAVRWRKQHQL